MSQQQSPSSKRTASHIPSRPATPSPKPMTSVPQPQQDPQSSVSAPVASSSSAAAAAAQPPTSPTSNPRKRKGSAQSPMQQITQPSVAPAQLGAQASSSFADISTQPPTEPAAGPSSSAPPPPKKSRTNTPWTAAEEQRLKQMRDQGKSWSEIAKTFPNRTEGSVKKHWYKDMHYAEFDEEESQALLTAIKEYEAAKWKTIGIKLGKPAKACEQYAKQHFSGK